MSEQAYSDGSRWKPGPKLLLARQYHPNMSADHPAFSKLPFKKQQLVSALHKQYEHWYHKPYFRQGLPGRLITVLNDYWFAQKLADCAMKTNPYAKNPNPYAKKQAYIRCNLDWFCGYCAYIRGQDLLKKYTGSPQEAKPRRDPSLYRRI